MQGVQAIKTESTAFAFRSENLLVAPLITYVPDGPEFDKEALNLVRNFVRSFTRVVRD